MFVHESERKHEPRLGEAVEVRIIGHNEKGELNGSFLPLAHERLDEDGQVIFDLLVEYDGELPFWDKSSPEAIKEVFNMSKGSFKRAIGHLYKRKIINIETGKITLTKKVKVLFKNNEFMKIEFLPYYIDSLKPLKGHTFSGFLWILFI